MRTRWLTVIVAAALAVAALPTLVEPAAADHIDETSTEGVHILTIPGTTEGTAVAINDDTWIALTDAVWPATGEPIPITNDAPAGSTDHEIFDMNNDGTMVGSYEIGGVRRGFAWTPGNFVDIGEPSGLPGGVESVEATAIADDGRIVGLVGLDSGSCGPSGIPVCTFLATPESENYTFEIIPEFTGGLPGPLPPTDIEGDWVISLFGVAWSSVTGTFEDIQSIAPTGLQIELTDINGSAQIAGNLIDGNVETAIHIASPTAPAYTLLGTLPGHVSSEAEGINAAGDIVGWSSPQEDPTFEGDFEAYVWDGTSTIPLGTLLTGDRNGSRAMDINDEGLVVGQADGRPVIWDLDGDFAIVHPGPAMNSIKDITITLGQTISFAVSSTGATSPRYDLFSGSPGSLADPPDGATIDNETDTVAWTPTGDQVGATTLTVRVEDDDDPTAQPGYATFTVTVLSDPGEPVSISVQETIGVGDSITVAPPVTILVVERISVEDTISVRPPVLIEVNETIVVRDDVRAEPPIEIVVSETIGVTDTTSVTPPVSIVVVETIGVTDDVAARPPIAISITESIVISDDASTERSVTIAVSEVIGVVDETLADTDTDFDADGIENPIDGFNDGSGFIDESAIPSDRFSDEHLPGDAGFGTTYGSILARAGVDVSVADAEATDRGVTVTVTGPDGGPPVRLALCGLPGDVVPSPGTISHHTCGSHLVEVDEGLVSLFTSDGARVDVPAGSSVLLADGDTVRIEVIVGVADVVVGSTTVSLVAGDVLENPGIQDADGDGLTDSEEQRFGTDAEDADTDGDGLIDGLDPSWLGDLVSDIPRSSFRPKVAKFVTSVRLFIAEFAASRGQYRIASSIVTGLIRRYDGCGSRPDRNDWLRSCDEQPLIHEGLAVLRRNLMSVNSGDSGLAPR